MFVCFSARCWGGAVRQYSWHTPITMTIISTPFAPLPPSVEIPDWCRTLHNNKTLVASLSTVKFKLLHNTSFQCKPWAHPVWNKSEDLVQLSSLITLQWDIPPTPGPQNECSPAGSGGALSAPTFLHIFYPSAIISLLWRIWCVVPPLCSNWNLTTGKFESLSQKFSMKPGDLNSFTLLLTALRSWEVC